MQVAPAVEQALVAAAVERCDHGIDRPLLLICEHASPAVPPAWQGLGLARADLERHIGWDIGAAAVTRALAERLGATALLARYSRLFLDCNRDPATPEAMPAVSDGIAVPGNQTVDAAERAQRRRIAFDPLHTAIAADLDRRQAQGQRPLLLAVHSFTPALAGGPARPWDLGLLWNECDDVAERLLEALDRAGAATGDMTTAGGGARRWVVGRNQPYSAKDYITFTLDHHGRRRGLDNLAVELRNDHLQQPAAGASLVTLLASALSALV